MQTSSNDKKAERPPRQKRSKTITNDTHFPGPLFPAVRQVPTTHPLSSDLRVSVDSDVSSFHSNLTRTSSNSNGSSEFSMSSLYERDWMYPSFLGPHMGRDGAKVKEKKAQKQEFNGGVQGKVVGDKEVIQTLEEEKRVREKGKEEKKEVVVISQTQSNSVSQLSGRTRRVKSSLMYYLVSSEFC